MKNLDTIAEQLFNEIRGRFPSIELGDAEGNITNEPALARFYDFDFESNGNKLGKVSVSLDEDDGVVVMFSKDFVESEFGSIKTDWYGFLKNLRTFTKKRLLNFEVRDINRSNLTKRDYKFLASNRSGEQTMAESRMYGNAKTSFQKIGGAKLSIKHTGAIEEGGSRTSKIGAIFIENTDGERFKYPYKHLSGARALALHISEGGHPFDDFGKYITGLSEELSNLRKFKTYMGRSSVMAESLAEHMGTVNERMVAVKKEIQNLQKPSYYAEAFEQYVPIEETEVPSEVAENWIDQLTVKQFNEELKDVFPYIYNLVSETTKTKELHFEDIINEQQDMIYNVKRGDTVIAIARAYNIAVEDIIEVNGLDDNGTIRAGDQLTLPGVNPNQQIGASPTTPGATRGIDPAQNYSAADLARLTGQPGYSEAIDRAIDSLMGQFADSLSEAHTNEATCGCKPSSCSHCGGKHTLEEVGEKCDCCGNMIKEVKAEGKQHDKDGDGDEDSDDYKIAKDIAIKKAIARAAEEEPKKESKTPLGEFILSYFDRETGQFPKGPTAVLTMVEKEYGERFVRPAQKFIERIDAKVAEVMGYREADNFNLDEAGQELGNLIKTGVSGAYKYIEKTIKDFEVLLQQNPNHPKAQQYRQELDQLKKMLANAQMQMGESIFKKAKILEAKQEIYRIKQLAEAATAADANALTQAVKDFQTAAGLEADGVVGPQTKEAHKAAMANSTAAIDNKMNADAAATRDPNSPQAPGDAAAPAQGQQGDAPAPTARTAGQGQFERSVQVGGQVYANDADAISALMGKGARTQEEETWLTGKAREYGFYGNQAALPGILDRIRQGAAAQDAADDAAAVDGDPATAQPRAQGAANANYPSMAAAMQNVNYWEPGEQVTIAGQPHVRDVDAQGNKIFRPVNQQGAAAPAAAPLPGSGGPRTRGGRRGTR